MSKQSSVPATASTPATVMTPQVAEATARQAGRKHRIDPESMWLDNALGPNDLTNYEDD